MGANITATRPFKSRPGTRASSISTRPTRARPIATRSRASSPISASRSANSPRISRVRWFRSIRPMTRCSTASVPTSVRGDPEKRRHWAADRCARPRKSRRRFGLSEHVSFTGSLAWPYFYPYPQRPAGLIEECFAEQGAALEADPRRLRGQRRRSLLRDPSERGRIRRRHLRDVPRRGRRTPALQHQLRRQPFHQAVHGLSRLHRRLPRAHQDVPRQGRRIQPDRQAGRLRRLSRAGSSAPGATARSATGRSTSRRSSPSSPPTISPAGRSTNGSAACSIPKSPRATARSSSPTTSSK